MVNTPNRRPTEWFTTSRLFTLLADGAQTNETLLSAAGIGARFIKGTTITRMIIDLRLKPATIAQQTSLFWGIVVMNSDARAAGAFPDTDDVSDRPDWMIRGRMQSISENLSKLSNQDHRVIDLKSQRVLHSEEDELQLIFDNTSEGFAIFFSLFIRVLVKWAD